jgi:hypothetical protein
VGIIEPRALDAPVLQADDYAPVEKAAGAAIYLDEIAIAEEFLQDSLKVFRAPRVETEYRTTIAD